MFTTKGMIKELIGTKFEDIPPAVVEKIKWAILDDVGITFQGYNMAGKVLADYAKDAGGRPESTVVGDGVKVATAVAAGVNAAMGYDSDYNESGSGHVLNRINSTAIAVGERLGSSGREIITAEAAVYELNGRFMDAAKAHDYLGGLMASRHAILIAALVCGKLMKIDETQMNSLIGLAWMIPPPEGIGSLVGPSIRNRVGTANILTCQVGVQAALLAKNGFGGPLDVLEKVNVYDLERLSTSPASYHYAMERLYLKTWPSTHSTHQPIDNVTSILKDERVQLDQIEQIKVFLRHDTFHHHPWSTEPKDYFDAIYSIPWSITMAILGYEPGPAWFTQERFKDPKVLDLVRRVKIVKEERPPQPGEQVSTKLTPLPSQRQRVEVSVKEGRNYTRESIYIDLKGGPKRPHSKEELEAKFRRLVTPVIGKDLTEELFVGLSRLEEIGDIRDLTKLYGRQ